jgi:hypothetical protein
MLAKVLSCQFPQDPIPSLIVSFDQGGQQDSLREDTVPTKNSPSDGIRVD